MPQVTALSTAVNKDWFDWTRHNLNRGCSPAEIKSILLKNSVSEQDALIAMSCQSFSEFKTRKSQLPKAPGMEYPNEKNVLSRTTFDFKASANVSLLTDPKLEAFAAESLQLFRIRRFLSSAECNALIALINSELRPSTVTTGEDKTGFRTSSTCDLGDQRSKMVNKIDKKIARALGVRLPWSETMQGQKYEVGQEFKAHTDYFEPGTKEFEEFASSQGQRTWTFMIYLNNTPEGGHTYFTEVDLSFAPEAGTALIWNNLNEDGSPNPLAAHHGMPVIKGKKLIITKWFRAKGSGKPFF